MARVLRRTAQESRGWLRILIEPAGLFLSMTLKAKYGVPARSMVCSITV